jgi:hypothetical protein
VTRDIGAEPGGGMGGDLPARCTALSGALGELALGTLTGRERAALVAHLEKCTACSAEVDALSLTADQLLHLAPTAEPPVGFEAGVFQRLGLQQRTRGSQQRTRGKRYWPAWRPKLVASMAAGALVLAFGLGALLGFGTAGGGSGRPAAASQGPIQVASLFSGGHAVGQVFVYAGNPTWLFMDMNNVRWEGALRCEVVVDQGPTITLGRFWLSDGKGAWAASVSQPAGRLVEARVVGASGRVLASADLS